MMNPPKIPVRVLFRKSINTEQVEVSGNIYAVLPFEPFVLNNTVGLVRVFMMKPGGEHEEGITGFNEIIARTIPAIEAEYRDLMSSLEEHGFEVEVVDNVADIAKEVISRTDKINKIKDIVEEALNIVSEPVEIKFDIVNDDLGIGSESFEEEWA